METIIIQNCIIEFRSWHSGLWSEARYAHRGFLYSTDKMPHSSSCLDSSHALFPGLPRTRWACVDRFCRPLVPLYWFISEVTCRPAELGRLGARGLVKSGGGGCSSPEEGQGGVLLRVNVMRSFQLLTSPCT